jgi:glycogen debranching enzyme
VYVDAKLSVVRLRAVGNGFHEELTILNHANEPVDLSVRLEAGCDFADLFEVKDALKKKGTYSARVKGGKLVLAYDRGTFSRWTVISSSQRARVDKNGLSFKIRIGPHGAWSTQLDVVTEGLGIEEADRVGDPARSKRHMRKSLQRWLELAPRLESDLEPVKATYRRSLVDLAALRFSPRVAGGRSLPAAGLPWFMAMFGRDSILTSLQALPFASELAATTLRALGDWQGIGVDDFRDEDPGRILHEMRYGELTAFEERPHSPYYGSADATPLFVVLLDEYERWTLKRAPPSTGSTSTRISRAPATSGTSAATRRPGSRTSAGRTPGIRSRSRTGGSRASRARPASSRATPTTRSSAPRAWHGSSGETRI